MRALGIVASLALTLIIAVSLAVGQVPPPLTSEVIDLGALDLSVSEARGVKSIKIQGFDFEAKEGRKLAVVVLKSGHKKSGKIRLSKETFAAVYGNSKAIEPAMEVDTPIDLIDRVHWSAKVETTYSQPTTITIALVYSLPVDISEISLRYESSSGLKELPVHLAPF